MTCCGIGRPLTTLRRYSGICSIVSGVPCASSSTACLAISFLQPELAHHTHHGLHVLDRRFWNNAVAEIEDVAGASGCRAQNLLHAQLEHFRRSEQSDGVKIALHRVAVTHGAPALIEGLPPVESDHVRAC